MLYDFRIEWCSVAEEKPIAKTAVLVYSGRFKYGYNVCIYDGISHWILDGFKGALLNFVAKPCDLWAYLPDTDEM